VSFAEVVQKQKRVEVGRVAEPERAPQAHPRTFDGRPGTGEPLNRSNGHLYLQELASDLESPR
jgi:hypothetical protein